MPDFTARQSISEAASPSCRRKADWQEPSGQTPAAEIDDTKKIYDVKSFELGIARAGESEQRGR